MAVKAQVVEDWYVLVRVSGELDAYMAPELRETVEQVLDGGARWLLIDLSDVEYLDSVGLGIMIGAAQRASEREGDIAVVCTRPNVMRVLEVSGTKELLNVVGTVEEGRAKLSAARDKAASQAGRGEG
ncbi:MAG: STAS domain-containing protein [Armatimonadetes bacterium]|nr:STAS domain-containing protein [Armatimonadota bacterium]